MTTGLQTKPLAQRRTLLAATLHVARHLVNAILLAGLLGYFVRDRSLLLAWMMYVPLPLVGGGALILNVVTARKLRRLSIALSLAALVLGVVRLFGWNSPHSVPAGAATVRILHWNVLWGGGESPDRWRTICARILAQSPDIVLLSEAPNQEWLDELVTGLGSDWKSVRFQHPSRERYTFHLAAISRYHVIVENTFRTSDARFLQVRLDLPEKPMRILLCDGLSDPLIRRGGRLEWVRNHIEMQQQQGMPVDVVAGDFNSPGSCIGFDAFTTMAGGYVRASDSCGGWRGTWPSVMPMWNIDHVFVHRQYPIVAVQLFTTLQSDHRGQTVTIMLSNRINEQP